LKIGNSRRKILGEIPKCQVTTVFWTATSDLFLLFKGTKGHWYELLNDESFSTYLAVSLAVSDSNFYWWKKKKFGSKINSQISSLFDGKTNFDDDDGDDNDDNNDGDDDDDNNDRNDNENNDRGDNDDGSNNDDNNNNDVNDDDDDDKNDDDYNNHITQQSTLLWSYGKEEHFDMHNMCIAKNWKENSIIWVGTKDIFSIKLLAPLKKNTDPVLEKKLNHPT